MLLDLLPQYASTNQAVAPAGQTGLGYIGDFQGNPALARDHEELLVALAALLTV